MLSRALPQSAVFAMQACTMRSPTCLAVTIPVREMEASAESLTPQDQTAWGASGLEACIWSVAPFVRPTPLGATNTVMGKGAGGGGETGGSPSQPVMTAKLLISRRT